VLLPDRKARRSRHLSAGTSKVTSLQDLRSVDAIAERDMVELDVAADRGSRARPAYRWFRPCV